MKKKKRKSHEYANGKAPAELLLPRLPVKVQGQRETDSLYSNI